MANATCDVLRGGAAKVYLIEFNLTGVLYTTGGIPITIPGIDNVAALILTGQAAALSAQFVSSSGAVEDKLRLFSGVTELSNNQNLNAYGKLRYVAFCF
jgi:hypothetical protein